MSAASDEKTLETKIAIVNALNELCKTRAFSRVGIIDVVKEAGIGRSSFYYHFTDRNDAVQWLSRLAFERGIDQIGRTLSYFNGHYATTRLLMQYRPLICAASEDGSYAGAELFFIRHRAGNLHETLTQRGVEVDDELAFLIRALAASEQNMTISFIRGEFGDMDAKTFCKRLVGIVPKRILDALDESSL